MKLAIHNDGRVWGGNEKWLTTLAAGLRDRGHEVVVACRDPGPVQERLAARGIRVSGARPRGELDLLSVYRFTRWLARERPDTLLLTSWNRIAWGSWAARRAGVRRVVVRLGIVRPAPRPGRIRRALRHRVDALIVNSSAVRDEWLRTADGLPGDGVHLVLNGIPPLRRRTDADAAALRRALGTEPGVPLVAGAGHLTRRKGFDLLLDAAARIAGAAPHLVIVGSGPEEEELRRRAERLGIAGRVHWLGFRPDVPALLRGADLFVLSSRNEGMANVMIEAMAVGVPVVAASVSGVAEILGGGPGREPAGWIVPPDDAGALGAAIEEVLADLRAGGAAVRARVDEALRRVERDLGVDRMVDEAERVLFPRAPGGAA